MINIRTTSARKLRRHPALAIPQQSAICFQILIPISNQARVTQDETHLYETKIKESGWGVGEHTASAVGFFLSFLHYSGSVSPFSLHVLFFQLMKICDSSMFQPIHRLLLIQFLQITLLLITYMDLDTCSVVSSSAYPALDTSLAWTYHIYLALLPSLWFFQGLLDPPPEEAITNNSIPTLNFS